MKGISLTRRGAGIRVKLKLITASGHIYSFLLEESATTSGFGFCIRRSVKRLVV
jgi:hypothetical protein